MENKLEVVANRFAILFGGPKYGACGCMGIKGGCTRCDSWWEMIFKADEEIKQRAFAIYDAHTKEIEEGVIKLLTKQILIPRIPSDEVFADISLENAIFKAIDEITMGRETGGSYRGTSSHLSQELTTAVMKVIEANKNGKET